MFTLDQIKAAHARVASGADFPRYIQDIIQLGVTGYETFVTDSRSIFFGKDDFKIQSEAKYTPLIIAEKTNAAEFIQDLKIHQQGKTSYISFCESCAKWGIEKWIVDMAPMTCTYYDKAGNEILVEKVPAA